MTTSTDPTGSSSANPFAALVQGSGSSSSNSSGASQVATAENTFLQLVTTQLKNQDPTSPTDTTAFTQELISLSGVEQQLDTNQTLSSMNTDLTTITQANGLGYVGKTVTASGATSPFQSGQAQWDYTLNSTAQTVTLNVQDSSGNTIFSQTGNPASGQHNFSWPGTTTSGTPVTSGDYTLQVTATDASGSAVSTTTSMVGQVTGVDTSSGSTQLAVGDIQVPIGNVTAIN